MNHEFLRRMQDRLRHGFKAGLFFSALGNVNFVFLSQLPELIDLPPEHSVPQFLLRCAIQLLVNFFCALVIVLALRMSCDRAVDLIRRPWLFLIMISLCCVIGSCIGWEILKFLRPDIREVPISEYIQSWLDLMLWGGLLGWLFLLYLQRVEDRLMFASLLGKRAMLARQLAHSTVAKARAQIDPELLTQILNLVHAHHISEPEQALALLDQLIDYLRLAMQRKREQASAQLVDAAYAELLLSAKHWFGFVPGHAQAAP